MATEAMMDGAVCLMCLMRLLMWLLAHAVDGCVDMDDCFVFALLSLGVASRCPYGHTLNASAIGRLSPTTHLWLILCFLALR